MALTLHVVTPTQDALNVECDEVIVPGVNGEIGFLPSHVSLITALRPGVLVTIRDGQRSLYVVGSGFAELEKDCVTLCTDSFEPASSVDVELARRVLHDAEDKLKTLSPEDPGYAEASRRASHAHARMDGAARAGVQAMR